MIAKTFSFRELLRELVYHSKRTPRRQGTDDLAMGGYVVYEMD